MTNMRTAQRLNQAFAQMMQTNPSTIQTPVFDFSADIARSMEPRRKLDRYQPVGGLSDTIVGYLSKGILCNIRQGSFIDDDEIHAVITRPDEFDHAHSLILYSRNIPYGSTPYMRAMVQQVGTRGCIAACSAMICLDNRIEPDWKWVATCDLSTSEYLMEALALRGLTSVKYELPKNRTEAAHLLELLLATYYAGVLSVTGELGGHVVVLDFLSLRYDLAIFREPYHGWCLATSAETLLGRIDDDFVAAIRR